MKELSIEQKAKAYDEALKWMEGIYPTLTHEQQMEAEAFFPKLKESEDERIRKGIIEGLREMKSSFRTISSIKIDDAIAWLEKQDIFSKKDIDDAYLKGVRDTKNEIEKQYEANYQIRKEWSEEDKEYLRRAINATKDVYPMTADWLKSLKDRLQK